MESADDFDLEEQGLELRTWGESHWSLWFTGLIQVLSFVWYGLLTRRGES